MKLNNWADDLPEWASLIAQLVKKLPAMQETWEGNSNLPQYSGLENPMDCIVHGVAKSQI